MGGISNRVAAGHGKRKVKMQNPFLQAGTIDPPAELRAVLSSAIGPLLMVAGCRGNFAVMASQPAPGRVPFIIEFKGIDAAGTGRSTMDQAVVYYRRRFAEPIRTGRVISI